MSPSDTTQRFQPEDFFKEGKKLSNFFHLWLFSPGRTLKMRCVKLEKEQAIFPLSQISKREKYENCILCDIFSSLAERVIL